MAKTRSKSGPVTVASINRTLRLAEMEAAEKGNPGTGATILRLRGGQSSPIGRMVDAGKIGPEGLSAATEIEEAFSAITNALWIRPISMERQDRSYGFGEPERIANILGIYRKWADYWSVAKKQYGCFVLPMTIGAVIDWRSPRDMCGQYGVRFHRCEQAIVTGLMDYARRAGWLTRGQETTWLERATTLTTTARGLT
jgi:hypothetical protein